MSPVVIGAAVGPAIALVLCFAGSLWGAPIAPRELSPYRVIRAESAVIRHGDQVSDAPASLFDGTGLSHENPLLAHHGSDPDTIWQYPITSQQYPVAVELDLGGEFLVNELWIWQLQGQLEDQGLLEFDIVMRDGNYREVGMLEGTLDEFDRVGVQPVQRFNAFGECIFLPIPDCVRFIELRIHRNRGDSQWLGLAEIAFAGWAKLESVPEPASASGLMLAACLLCGTARQRHKRLAHRGQAIHAETRCAPDTPAEPKPRCGVREGEASAEPKHRGVREGEASAEPKPRCGSAGTSHDHIIRKLEATS